MKSTTLDNNISRFVRKFGVKRARMGNQFVYLANTQTMNYTVLQYETDEDYIEYLNSTYEIDVRPWYFVFCILHEVGHHMTIGELSEEDYTFEYIMRKHLLGMIDDQKKVNELYFQMPAEDLANRWAIEYIAAHPEECWRFQWKCYSIMRHLFKKKSFARH